MRCDGEEGNAAFMLVIEVPVDIDMVCLVGIFFILIALSETTEKDDAK